VGVKSDGCHLRELDLCFATLSTFAKPSGVARTEADLDNQCSFLVETEECIEDFVDDCMPDTMKLLADQVLNGTTTLRQEFCNENSTLRANYLEHGDCISRMLTEAKPCFTDLGVAFEMVTNNETKGRDRIPLLCCSVYRVKTCLKSIIIEKCSAEAWDFYADQTTKLIGRLPGFVCEEYPEDSEICGTLPPPGTPPAKRIKGKKMSILNRLLAAYTGF